MRPEPLSFTCWRDTAGTPKYSSDHLFVATQSLSSRTIALLCHSFSILYSSANIMSTLIYAELLSNIRQISILAELPTPSDASTKVSFQSGRKYLYLLHQGTTTKLELPGEVSGTYVPQQPAPGLKQISWRIPLKPQPPQAHPSFAESTSAPWSASDLDSSSSLACRACSIPIVEAGTIKTWQDLPSANWAEMMDFWHCHKPDVPKVEQNGEESGLVEKGYGANASFRAQRGVGKVDLMTFLFSKEDCAVSMVRIYPALLFLLPVVSLHICYS